MKFQPILDLFLLCKALMAAVGTVSFSGVQWILPPGWFWFIGCRRHWSVLVKLHLQCSRRMTKLLSAASHGMFWLQGRLIHYLCSIIATATGQPCISTVHLSSILESIFSSIVFGLKGYSWRNSWVSGKLRAFISLVLHDIQYWLLVFVLFFWANDLHVELGDKHTDEFLL